MRRLLGPLFLLVLTIVGVPAGQAAAGGWAVTTLDAVPTPQVGEVESVGFVIRQHGVTPVRLDGDVGVEVRSPSGRVDFFPATPSGAVGHYVAEVVFHEPGAAAWTIHQGWFGPQDLGIVAVGTGATTSATTRDRDWPAVVRFGLPVLAFAAAAAAIGDAARSRRRAAT